MKIKTTIGNFLNQIVIQQMLKKYILRLLNN